MLIIHRLKTPSAEQVSDYLVLPFEFRRRSRLRACTVSGEDVRLFLPLGHIMRNGDLLEAEDGRIIQIVAKQEQLMEVRSTSAQVLTRAAYRLGNLRAALQIGDAWLRVAEDNALRQMLLQLNAQVTDVEAPFDPEPSADDTEHPYQSDEHGHSGAMRGFGDEHW